VYLSGCAELILPLSVSLYRRTTSRSQELRHRLVLSRGLKSILRCRTPEAELGGAC